MAGFYMVYLDRNLDVTIDDVKKTFDLALEWYRINSELWIIYSTGDAEKWYSRLKKYIKDGGHIFVCKLNIADRQGWMSKEFWNWLRETRLKYTE